MKSKIIFVFVGVVGLFGLAGCKPKPIALTGQVFIVTRGAENIKLGLVEVCLIPKQQVCDFLKIKSVVIANKIAACKKEFTISSNSLEQAEANLKDFETENQSTTSDYKSMLDDYKTNTNYGIRIVVKYKLDQIDRKVDAEKLIWEQRAIDAKMRFSVAMTKLANYPDGDAYFADFSPSPIQKSLTDADGKFSLVCSANANLAIFAKADRMTGARTEKYYWLINVPAGPEITQVFLSNQNLINIDPDSYFKIKPVDASREAGVVAQPMGDN